MAPNRLTCFAVCTPGLEALTAGELADLGIRTPRPTRGGVEFRATTRQLYAANLWSRTATRILVRIGSFRAATWPELLAGADELAWYRWLPAGRPVRFRISSSGSRLYHTGAIEQRLRGTLGLPPATASRPPAGARDADHDADGPDDDEALVVVRVVRNRVTISVDSSGAPLHRRGWRLDGAKAPLRETLAASLLLAAGWDGRIPLVDPFCGSGTIAIEAALLARNAAPGRDRLFAFGEWPGFEPGTWASVVEESRRAERERAGVTIVAADRDAGAVAATRSNAERAGVEDDLVVREAAVSDLRPPATPDGWLITNPPFGTRVQGGRDLRDLYARLGDVVRATIPGWRVGLLVADPRLAGHTRLPLTESLRTTTGGIAVRFLTTPGPAAGEDAGHARARGTEDDAADTDEADERSA